VVRTRATDAESLGLKTSCVRVLVQQGIGTRLFRPEEGEGGKEEGCRPASVTLLPVQIDSLTANDEGAIYLAVWELGFLSQAYIF